MLLERGFCGDFSGSFVGAEQCAAECFARARLRCWDDSRMLA